MISADEKLAIYEFLAQHYSAVDRADTASFVANFADDGVFVLRDGQCVIEREVEGRAALESLAARFSEPSRIPSRHYFSNIMVEPEADGARGSCSVMRVETAADAAILDTGVVDFSVRKVDEKWCLARYDLSLDRSSRRAPRL